MDNVFFFVWCIPYFEELNTKNPNYGAFGRKIGMVGWFEGSPAKGQKKRLNILLIFLNGFDRFVCILSGREIIHFLNRLFAAIVFFIFAFPPHPLIVVLRTELLKCFIFTQKNQSFFGLVSQLTPVLQTALQSQRWHLRLWPCCRLRCIQICRGSFPRR